MRGGTVGMDAPRHVPVASSPRFTEQILKAKEVDVEPSMELPQHVRRAIERTNSQDLEFLAKISTSRKRKVFETNRSPVGTPSDTTTWPFRPRTTSVGRRRPSATPSVGQYRPKDKWLSNRSATPSFSFRKREEGFSLIPSNLDDTNMEETNEERLEKPEVTEVGTRPTSSFLSRTPGAGYLTQKRDVPDVFYDYSTYTRSRSPFPVNMRRSAVRVGRRRTKAVGASSSGPRDAPSLSFLSTTRKSGGSVSFGKVSSRQEAMQQHLRQMRGYVQSSNEEKYGDWGDIEKPKKVPDFVSFEKQTSRHGKTTTRKDSPPSRKVFDERELQRGTMESSLNSRSFDMSRTVPRPSPRQCLHHMRVDLEYDDDKKRVAEQLRFPRSKTSLEMTKQLSRDYVSRQSAGEASHVAPYSYSLDVMKRKAPSVTIGRK